jgi:hypothetical protein
MSKASNTKQFIDFLEKNLNKGYSRTRIFKEFKKQGGKIREQTAHELSRKYLNIQKGEFEGLSVKKIQNRTNKEIEAGKRKEIELVIPKKLKPSENESSLMDREGNYIPKVEAKNIYKLQRKIKEETGQSISRKELALSKISDVYETKYDRVYGYNTRSLLKSDDGIDGPRAITIIDRNGNKHTFYGTYNELLDNPEFKDKLDEEQQRVFAGAEKTLRDRGLDPTQRRVKDSEEYKVFQFQMSVKNYLDEDLNVALQVIDYRDLSAIDSSPISAEELNEARKGIRRRI